ncbi:hypothetical protein [Flectobacillus roseus]|uniref:Uncharacterized protein n=1 Tax=Flectobacillus roseus TaxID=502259 RepID=A0ABT6Y3C1_9BACT|nr:hypothetical protein [Flectobacillus roseus]MDI9858055.1 hypothetical protein [Flectobacillus roseus]
MIPKEDIMLYPEAFDIDWFIVFKDGEVAQFFSSGGEIPKLILEHYEDLPAIANYLNQLPPTTNSIENTFTSKLFHEGNKTFEQVSRKGILVYDRLEIVKDSGSVYYLLSFPETVLTVDNLPFEIKKLLTKVQVQTKYSPDLSYFDTELMQLSKEKPSNFEFPLQKKTILGNIFKNLKHWLS